MSYLPFTSNPLIALYEDSGQSISAQNEEKILQLDTSLHQGELNNNTFILNNFNCFLTSDIKYDKGGTTGYGTALKMYIEGSQAVGIGCVQSGNVSGYSQGAGGEIVASNVSDGQEVQIKFKKGGTQTVTFNTFTRIIGIIT